ncbi:tRNA nuclease WapA [bacterium HR15]|nr:tRNA nuclease WapA [bacterium HR15]
MWSYDSWGNPIEREVNPAYGTVEQPFTWNGAYGYEWDCFANTNLYHVGAREYDPRTARWLQRDPIDVAGRHPNGYLYCGNEPVNDVDPTGMDTHVYEFAEYILVVTTIQFRGPNANQANCERVVNSMLLMWNQQFTSEGKPVIFFIDWEIGGKEKPSYDQVWMVSGKARSYVHGKPVIPNPLWIPPPFYPPLRPNQQHTCLTYSVNAPPCACEAHPLQG